MGSIKRQLEEGKDYAVNHSQTTVAAITSAKAVLEGHRSSSFEAILLASSQLKELGQLSTEVLRETQIGKAVSQAAKETTSEEVQQVLKELLADWKRLHRESGKIAKTATSGGRAEHSVLANSTEIPTSAPADASEMLTAQLYRKRLEEQNKYLDPKPGTKCIDNCLQDPPALPPQVMVLPKSQPPPELTEQGHFFFSDFPEFKPNLSPKQVLQAGCFGGGYFRNISSAVTGVHYKGKEVIAEFPPDWFEGLSLEKQVTSQDYFKSVNRYGVACGGGLGMWETSGWISSIDPYGWFQWYCRFFLGRRSSDDARQVDRWLKGQGPKGRWRLQLMNKIIKEHKEFDDAKVSPVIRQVLLHWAYELTPTDLESYLAK